MTQYKYLDFLETYQQDQGTLRRGCTVAQIDAIEEQWGVKLPLAYRELYQIKGYGGFAFFEGNDYRFNEYEQMRIDAAEIAEPESKVLVEDPNTLVFGLYGPFSRFWFFKLDEGDDPPVYEFDESRTWHKIADSFSDFIRAQDWYQHYLQQTNRQ